MKKIIFILALFVSFVANAQKTTGSNYTYFNTRSEWFTGIFQALGLPSGSGPAAFKAGQDIRAGALYYDSVGVDSGLHIWTGAYWRNYATEPYTDADARAAISLTTTGTSGAATYTSATGVFNIPVYAGTLNANVGAFYRWLKPATQEIKTFAPGYGIILDSASNADAITAILDSATVFPDIRASIESPNLIVDSIGVAGTDVIVARNDSLLHRLIATGINYILVDTIVSTGEIRIRLDTASATFKAYIAANSGGGGGSGTVNSGTQYRIAYYATTGDAVSEAAAITASRALVSDANGVPTHATTTATQVDYLSGAAGTTGTNNLVFSTAPTFETNLNIPDGTSTVASLKFNNGGSGNLGFYRSGSNFIGVSVGSTEYYRFSSSTGFVIGGTASLGFGNTVGSPDVRLFRDGASGILAQRNGTNAQEFRIYNTDATDDEYVSMGFANTANVFTIETEETGSGTIRDIEIKSGAANTRITKLAGSGTRLVTADASGNLATKALVTLTRHGNVIDPLSSDDRFVFSTDVAITITSVKAVLVGSSTPSVTYNIVFDADRSAVGTDVFTAGQTVTSTTTMTAASGVNDATIPAGSIVRIKLSAVSGTVGELDVSITYTED